MKWTLIFIMMISTAAHAGTCVPTQNSCDFYLCQEQQHQCGPNGYPLGFGHYFCQKFVDHADRFSAPAQAFLQDVRLCLMRQLAAEDQGLSCNELKTTALDSHVGCYVVSGFCELEAEDQMQIMWVMRASAQYPEVLKNAVRLEMACEKREDSQSK